MVIIGIDPHTRTHTASALDPDTHRVLASVQEFVHGALLVWLQERQRIWPHTPNRHVLVSAVTATGTAPISDYYLSWHLLLPGIQLEQIRGDRVLHEALAVGTDPLHLAAVFNLSSATAIAYADIARSLLDDRSRGPPRSRSVSNAFAGSEPGRAHDDAGPGSLIEPDAITLVSGRTRWVRSDYNAFTLNTPGSKERDMPEAMLPAVVLVLYSERGRSERAGPRGMSTARSTPVSTV